MRQESTSIEQLLPPEITCFQNLSGIHRTLVSQKASQFYIDTLSAAALDASKLARENNTTAHVNEINTLLENFSRLLNECEHAINHFRQIIDAAKQSDEEAAESGDLRLIFQVYLTQKAEDETIDAQEFIFQINSELSQFRARIDAATLTEARLQDRIQRLFNADNAPANTPIIYRNYLSAAEIINNALVAIHQHQREQKCKKSHFGLDLLHQRIEQNITNTLQTFLSLQNKMIELNSSFCEMTGQAPPVAPPSSPTNSSTSSASSASFFSGSQSAEEDKETLDQESANDCNDNNRKRPRSPSPTP